MEDEIKALVMAQHFVVKTRADHVQNETQELEDLYRMWFRNFSVLSELMDMEIKEEDLIDKDGDRGMLVTFYLDSFIENDKISNKVQYECGDELAALYIFLTYIQALNYLVDIYIQEPSEMDRVAVSEMEKITGFADEYFRIFSRPNFTLKKYLSNDTILLIEKLGQEDKTNHRDYQKIYGISAEIVNNIGLDYGEIDYNLKRSKKLSDSLDACPRGDNDWKEYEQIAEECLRYLFLPSFNRIYAQHRTEKRFQVRDAIIPNTHKEGFWGQIKDEFDSKNIVVEFKNVSGDKLDQRALNQLSLYLAKKTIGRFGLLFVREKPGRSLLWAQREAYMDLRNMLILIIDDNLLKKLMICRALIGSCEVLLQKEKLKFELA
jgi:hypothetical protein